MPKGVPAWMAWFGDHRRWRAEYWPVAVYLTDEGMLLEGLDPEWEELRTWILDQSALSGLTPWQVVTKTMMEAQQKSSG